MADTTEKEAELIAQMQEDVAEVKKLLDRIDECAGKVASINHKAGRLIESADAMIWQGSIRSIGGVLINAHGVASKALIAGYDDGADIVAAGPIR